MFLLVTGASGVGKSTVGRALAPILAPQIECIELGDVSRVPAAPDLVWRQQATEAAVRRAVALQANGRHLLLAGDPVAPGEALAAPSAADVDAIAICLLDASPSAQATRLAGRGADPALLRAHQGFAAWMRDHARDPRHMPHVILSGGWSAMRWERWTDLRTGDPRWAIEIIDTSELGPSDVTELVGSWCARALAGAAPVFPAGWWRRPADA